MGCPRSFKSRGRAFVAMKLSMSSIDLFDYTSSQLQHFYPSGRALASDEGCFRSFLRALERVEECFKHIVLRGYSEGGEATFNALHSDQYSQYLYILSNQLWHDGAREDHSRKLLSLNRALNGIFVSYKLDLPPHFLFGHPLGTILGNASYGDGLVVYQGVTINSGKDGSGEFVPQIGRGCFFAAGSKVIGVEPIGDRVSVGVDAVVYKRPVPADSVVLNRNGASQIYPRADNKECFSQQFFDIVL